MKLVDRLREAAHTWGADLFGIGDLTGVRNAVAEQWGEEIAEYPRAVSLGIRLLHPIVDRLPSRAERAVALAYRHHIYSVTDGRLNVVATRIGGLLQDAGYRAWPIPPSEQYDEHLAGVFSHKLAARLAGLGWIGKNCLLITPGAGPRLRFATVLTDAPLEPAAGPLEPQCGDCSECADICPAGAITGRPFREDEPREARLDAAKCHDYLHAAAGEGAVAVCGLCMYVCLFGQRNRATTK